MNMDKPDVETESNLAQSRKRQRSQSMQSSTSSASNKRAQSDPRDSDDLDQYMATQGSQDDADSPQRRFGLIQDYSKRELVIGQTWYLVSKRWHRKWLRAYDPTSKEPLDPTQLPPVDNSDLYHLGELRRPLLDGPDVIYLPEEAWTCLQQWHGQSSTPIPRKVISKGQLQTLSIETYPPRLRVHRLVKDAVDISDESPVFVTASECDSLRTLHQSLSDSVVPTAAQKTNAPHRIWVALDIASDITDAWKATVPLATVKQYSRHLKPLHESDDTLANSSILSGSDDIFVVEFKASDGWLLDSSPTTTPSAPLFASGDGFFDKLEPISLPIGPAPLTSSLSKIEKQASSSSTQITRSPYFSKPAPRTISQSIEPGTLGLGNLGNTCFMNSALQCLAHTKELTDYFLSGVHNAELNPDNPLGMQGAIADSYGTLIQRIWDSTSSTGTSYSPREFKTQLSRFAPQFSGYQQQDSQELVAFLLDGLHEDLNRVIKKPYVEKPDWPDHVSAVDHDFELAKFAKQSWDGYKLRNDSVIVDLFQGQYQSTLICPECNKVSITFDPFMYLTLPLPVTKKWTHDIFYIPWDNDEPHLRIPIIMNNNASFKELRQVLGSWLSHPAENLLTMEVWSGRFYKNLDDNVTVGDLATNDLVVCFQLPCHAQQSRKYKRKPGDPFVVPVQLCDEPNSRYGGFARYSSTTTTSFGYPTIVVVTEEDSCSMEAIYAACVARLTRWTKVAQDLYKWEADSQVVDIQPNGLPPVDSITEISETGEVVTVQEGGVMEEADVADEKSMIIAESQDDDSSDFVGDLGVHYVGPKTGIFEIKVVTNNTGFGAGVGFSNTTRPTPLQTRSEEMTDENLSLLHPNDSFQLEFDENMKDYYFGEDQALWDLKSFELFEHPSYKMAAEAMKGHSSKDINFRDCLSEFTREEQLGEDDLWYCPRCKKHQQATKKFDLWKVPDILVVHLKRFSNNRLMRDKIDAFVDFPITDLDLTLDVGERLVGKRLAEHGGADLEGLGINEAELADSLVYDLFGVDEHLGGLGGGHYRAYASNHLTDKWYHFDDSYVTSSEPKRAINSNAYLLFYRRRVGSSSHLGGTSHLKTQEALSKTTEDSLMTDSNTTELSSSWASISASDFPPSSTHPSISIADDPTLTSLTSEEWRQIPSVASNTGSSGRSSPPSDDFPPDPLANANRQFDNGIQQYSFPDPSNSNGSGSPGSSTGVEVDSDRDFDDGDWNGPRSFSVQVTSPKTSPQWTGEVELGPSSDLSDPFIEEAELDGDNTEWVRAA